MNIAIDHVGIPAADPRASARFLAEILAEGEITPEGPDGEMAPDVVRRESDQVIRACAGRPGSAFSPRGQQRAPCHGLDQVAQIEAPGLGRGDGSGTSPGRCRPGWGSYFFFPFLLFLLFLATSITPFPTRAVNDMLTSGVNISLTGTGCR